MDMTRPALVVRHYGLQDGLLAAICVYHGAPDLTTRTEHTALVPPLD